MVLYEEKQSKPWNSYFYKSVMDIEYGSDLQCQKYGKIKGMCNFLAIAILENEKSLKGKKNGSDISDYQKVECDIAYKLKPLLWNPIGKEFTYLKSKTNFD